MNNQLLPLTVSQVEPIISGQATNVTFSVPPHLANIFRWQAGQHLTLKLDIDGTEHRRCYTISNPPDCDLRITVKRVQGGVISNYIADKMKIGSQIQALPPFGTFVLQPAATARRTHYFFGAGSGVTPLYAMISAVLKQEPYSVAHLILGNRTEKEIIFLDKLATLEKAHPDRLTVRHLLSSQTMWSSFSPWLRGRLDAAAIQAAIAETPPIAQDAQYWICGPGNMNGDVIRALTNIDVPQNRIHTESFGGKTGFDSDVSGIAATAQVSLNDRTTEVQVAQDQTLLEAILAAGLSPAFSCQSGVCGACRATLTSGDVHMRAHMALEDSEISAGEILTCQSIASSEQLSVRFKD